MGVAGGESQPERGEAQAEESFMPGSLATSAGDMRRPSQVISAKLPPRIQEAPFNLSEETPPLL